MQVVFFKSIQRLKSFFLFMLVLISMNGFSQGWVELENEGDPVSLKDRIYFGGDFGASFGSFTNVNISPMVGYKINKEFSVGVGLKYWYLANNTVVPRYSTNIFGGSVFSRYLIIPELFVHAEYEVVNREVYNINPNGSVSTPRRNVPLGLLGLGYNSGAGSGLSVQAMALYDLINDPDSPYPRYFGPNFPLYIRIGFAYNF